MQDGDFQRIKHIRAGPEELPSATEQLTRQPGEHPNRIA
jgi:hypothetical protein